MHSHTTEGLMQLVSEFGQCRWSEGTCGASFIAKGQERGQREEAAKLYEEIRSYATALCQQGEPTEAARDVLAERARQISAEGWTPEHDDEHVNGELAFAASSYAYHASSRSWVLQDFADGAECYASDEPPNYWPYSWDESWWKPKNPRRDLVRAAALILAEIERLDRRALSTSEGKTE